MKLYFLFIGLLIVLILAGWHNTQQESGRDLSYIGKEDPPSEDPPIEDFQSSGNYCSGDPGADNDPPQPLIGNPGNGGNSGGGIPAKVPMPQDPKPGGEMEGASGVSGNEGNNDPLPPPKENDYSDKADTTKNNSNN